MKRAVVINAISIVLVLFLSSKVPAEGSSQQKNNPFTKYQTEHYQIITDVSFGMAKKVGNHMEAILQEYPFLKNNYLPVCLG